MNKKWGGVNFKNEREGGMAWSINDLRGKTKKFIQKPSLYPSLLSIFIIAENKYH